MSTDDKQPRVKAILFGTEYFPQGALECNLTGRCPFFKNLRNPFRKKICMSIPCFGIIRLQKIPKTIGKTVVLENSSLLFLNK